MSAPQGPPLQQELFDSAALEKQNRRSLGAARLPTGSKRTTIREELRDTVMQISQIPTSHLQSRPEIRKDRKTGEMLSRPETQLITGAGHYQPERQRSVADRKDSEGNWVRTTHHVRDEVAVPNQGFDRTSLMVHELGHRHHLDKTGGKAAGMKEQAADPLHEGHADAYVDRYLPQSPQAMNHRRNPHTMSRMHEEGRHPFDPNKPRHEGYKRLESTGYSTNFMGDSRRGKSWDTTDRALYAATRAHSAETGETVNYPDVREAPGEVQRKPSYQGTDSRPRPGTDAALHDLVTRSPTAREAVDATTWTTRGKVRSMGEAADAASRRHQDRELLRQGQYVQEDLFGDKSAWRNQQGEQPRTLKDVSKTLKLDEQTKGAAPGATIRRGLL